MKVLFFLLLFSAVAVTVAAQAVDLNLERTTGKNKLRLNTTAVLPLVQPGNAVVVPQVRYLKQDGMPCLVPDLQNVVAIPNALPELIIPAVAAIPNPVLKADGDKPKTSYIPGSK